MRRNRLSQACNVATFEIALDEICCRQNRCFHFLQILLAVCFVAFVAALVYVALHGACSIFGVCDGGSIDIWLLACSCFAMMIVKLVERLFSVETSSETANRANLSLVAAGLGIAFDSHSRRLFSCREEVVQTCAGEVTGQPAGNYRSTTDH